MLGVVLFCQRRMRRWVCDGCLQQLPFMCVRSGRSSQEKQAKKDDLAFFPLTGTVSSWLASLEDCISLACTTNATTQCKADMKSKRRPIYRLDRTLRCSSHPMVPPPTRAPTPGKQADKFDEPYPLTSQAS